MTAAAWFLLGAFTAGPLLAAVLWLLLVPSVRRRAYDVCQEQARLQYAPMPACADGFHVNPPKHRRHSADHQMVDRPAPSGPVSILGKQAL